MKVARSKVVHLFEQLNYHGAGRWRRRRMLSEIKQLPEVITDETSVEDMEADNLLTEILEALAAGDDVDVVKDEEVSLDDAADVENPPEAEAEEEEGEPGSDPAVDEEPTATEDDGEPEPDPAPAEKDTKDKGKKQKQAKSPEEAQPAAAEKKKPTGVRRSEGRPYQAGLALSRLGMEDGITDAVVELADAALEKSNPTETKAVLKIAWHVINGWLDGQEEATEGS